MSSNLTLILTAILFSILPFSSVFSTEGKTCCASKTQPKTQGLSIELLSEVRSITPGTPFRLGLHLQHEDGFHTYWKNPGIVGIPTSLDWQLPEGFTASAIAWPYPELTKMADYPCYGFERDVLLLVTITPPKHIKKKSVTLSTTAQWMCCKVACYPGFEKYSITLPVGGAEPSTETQPLFHRADSELPQTSKDIVATLVRTSSNKEIQVSLSLPSEDIPVAVFNTDGQHTPDLSSSITKEPNGSYTLRFTRSEYSPEDHSSFPFILQTNNVYYKVNATQTK